MSPTNNVSYVLSFNINVVYNTSDILDIHIDDSEQHFWNSVYLFLYFLFCKFETLRLQFTVRKV